MLIMLIGIKMMKNHDDDDASPKSLLCTTCSRSVALHFCLKKTTCKASRGELERSSVCKMRCALTGVTLGSAAILCRTQCLWKGAVHSASWSGNHFSKISWMQGRFCMYSTMALNALKFCGHPLLNLLDTSPVCFCFNAIRYS